MSFYTSLTGLNAATAQLSVTSNNIANVGTTVCRISTPETVHSCSMTPMRWLTARAKH